MVPATVEGNVNDSLEHKKKICKLIVATENTEKRQDAKKKLNLMELNTIVSSLTTQSNIHISDEVCVSSANGVCFSNLTNCTFYFNYK